MTNGIKIKVVSLMISQFKKNYANTLDLPYSIVMSGYNRPRHDMSRYR